MIGRRGSSSGHTLILRSDFDKNENEDAPNESPATPASPTAPANLPLPAIILMDTQTKDPPPELELLST